ncbi:sigma D regulator [Motilimonas cestriensis]|uniref:Sigma D regulator n=1 Tax=Motilimonas cestriensis TaxID=2742685 RepID=A0ABS8WAD7_9GAMM|nr:sigma D regulator [Motilimonas cestriensis]MCE2594663.1 sigma D regulator [Motilimonas cestriensis]
MLTKLEQAKQEWGGTSHIIDNWLNDRQKVLVEYCELAGLPPYNKEQHSLPSLEQIQAFCQSLVDYMSTGHFEVYDQVVSECESHGEQSAKLAQDIYPRISDTTDSALEFNDKYADKIDDEAAEDFDHDLSQLGQIMEQRFELEDQLLATLHQKHLQPEA